MLTNKDYVELARIIRDATVANTRLERRILYDKFLGNLCFWLRMDNPNFDEHKFRAATDPTITFADKPQMTKRR